MRLCIYVRVSTLHSEQTLQRHNALSNTYLTHFDYICIIAQSVERKSFKLGVLWITEGRGEGVVETTVICITWGG